MRFALLGWLSLVMICAPGIVSAQDGFVSIVPGADLGGWHGRTGISPTEYAAADDAKRKAWNDDLRAHWKVEDNVIINDGQGPYLTTDKEYGDFELLIDYAIDPKTDSGIYLRAVPQVQIWDPDNPEQKQHGNEYGSGGLWNNSKGAPGKDPLVRADNPIREWNSFRIIMVGDIVSVWLNGKQVVDRARMENYWDRKSPIVKQGPIQLQTHGGVTKWRNVKVREIGAEEANKWLAEGTTGEFKQLFDGKSLAGWKGAVDDYEVVDGAIRCRAGKGGQLYTEETYKDFEVTLQFKLPPGGNNGLAIRYPGKGDPAYAGMCELQVLDNEAEKYAKLDPRQYHGSAYGIAPAKRGYLRPTGQWNYQKVTVKGSTVQVELNGVKILDADVATVSEYMANSPHPGKDLPEGYFGFAGHNDPVEFKDIRIRRL